MTSIQNQDDCNYEGLAQLFDGFTISDNINNGPKVFEATNSVNNVVGSRVKRHENDIIKVVTAQLGDKPSRKRSHDVAGIYYKDGLPCSSKRLRLRELHAYCDGSFRKPDLAGIGGVLLEYPESVDSRILVLCENVTGAENNNSTEFLAAHRILSKILTAGQLVGKFSKLTLHSDSKSVVDFVTDKCSYSKVEGLVFKHLISKSVKGLEIECGPGSVSIEWIKSHDMSNGNIAADILAKEAAMVGDDISRDITFISLPEFLENQFCYFLGFLDQNAILQSSLQFDILRLFCRMNRKQFMKMSLESRLQLLANKCCQHLKRNGLSSTEVTCEDGSQNHIEADEVSKKETELSVKLANKVLFILRIIGVKQTSHYQ